MRVTEESQDYFQSKDSGLSLGRNTCSLGAGDKSKALVDTPVPRPSSMIVTLVPCRPSLVRQDFLYECLNLRHSPCGVVIRHRRRPNSLIFF